MRSPFCFGGGKVNDCARGRFPTETFTQSNEINIKTATKEQFRDLGQRFHEEIARLGGPKEKAEERVALVRWLHEWTTKIYPEARSDRVKITAEHEAIVNAVLDGLTDVAAERMRDHLKKHNGRVIEEALSKPTKRLLRVADRKRGNQRSRVR